MQINRPTVLDMTPPKKSLLPTWRVFARREPVNALVETNSGSSALEMPEFSNSVFVAQEIILKIALTFSAKINAMSDILLSTMPRSFEPRSQ